MKSIKMGKKLKILFFATILLTATTIIISSFRNQNTYPLKNLYTQDISQGPSTVIREKMDISSNYTFTGNLYETINVLVDNIVIDGNGYTLRGNCSGIGFNLTGRSNVTIKNVVVTGWLYDFYLSNSSYNTLSGNTANNINNILETSNKIGICLNSGSNYNTLSNNTANNNGWGFYLQSSSNNTLSNNTATENSFSGFYLYTGSNYNNLSGNRVANNRWAGFHLYTGSNYNNLSGNTATYNHKNDFALWYSSYNIITGNTAVNFWDYKGFFEDSISYNNTFENNTVIATGLPLIGTLLWGAYISLYSYQQSIPSVSIFLIIGLLVTTVALVCSVVIYRRRKGATAGEGVWKLPRDAFLAGTVGGVMGAATTAIGIIWVIISYAFLAEVKNYLAQWGSLLSVMVPWSGFYGYVYHGYPFPLIPLYPSAPLFSVYSVILSMFLIVTGVLSGFGFYGAYAAGGGARDVVVLIFSIVGIASGALLISMGNLTTGYIYARVLVEPSQTPILPIPTPNFLVIWIGFIILGVTFLILGSVSTHVREMTEKPSASYAAGILSIIGAVFFILGSLTYPIILVIGFGSMLATPIILFIGFGLIFVAFILWSVVFYSSRNR